MMRPKTIVAATAVLLWSATGSSAIDVGVGGAGVSAGDGGVSASVGGASVGAGIGSDGSVSAGASVGGASVGASAGIGSGGASVGASADTGSGGASVGAGAGTGGGGSGAGGSAGGGSSGSSGGSSGPSGSNGPSGSSGSGGSNGPSNGGMSVQATTHPVPAVPRPSLERERILLPGNLRPNGKGGILSRREIASLPMRRILGIPPQVIDACRQTVVQAARPYDLVAATVVSYGQTRRTDDGGYLAPVFTRIVYRRQGGYEVRQAPIWCWIDQGGVVSGLSDMT